MFVFVYVLVYVLDFVIVFKENNPHIINKGLRQH